MLVYNATIYSDRDPNVAIRTEAVRNGQYYKTSCLIWFNSSDLRGSRFGHLRLELDSDKKEAGE